MRKIAYNELSLNREELEMGLLYLIGQHLTGEIDQEVFTRLYRQLLTRMEQEGVEMIQWLP